MMGNHFENLEQRRLMASDPVILLDGGVLRIGGTDV